MSSKEMIIFFLLFLQVFTTLFFLGVISPLMFSSTNNIFVILSPILTIACILSNFYYIPKILSLRKKKEEKRGKKE